MEKMNNHIKILVVFIISILLLSSCAGTMSLLRYDPESYFFYLGRRKSPANDALDIKDGFDSLVLFHFKADYSGSPSPNAVYLFFSLSDGFLNANPHDMERIKWDTGYKSIGIIAMQDKTENDGLHHQEGYAIFEVKSRVKELVVDHAYYEIGDYRYKIPIGRIFQIKPSTLHYIPNVSIEFNMKSYSSVSYKKPIIIYDESVFSTDIQSFKVNYPNLYNQFKDNIQLTSFDN